MQNWALRRLACTRPSIHLIAEPKTMPAERANGSLHTDQGQIDEPRLRRYKTLDLRTHRPRVEIVDDVEPGRVVDEAFVRLAEGSRDHFRIGGFRKGLEGVVECVILPLLEIEAVRCKIGG